MLRHRTIVALTGVLVCLPQSAFATQAFAEGDFGTISRAGFRELVNQDIREVTGLTPRLRLGQPLADGRMLQVRGPLNNPSFYVDGVRLTFTIDGIDLSGTPQPTDSGAPLTDIDPQDLASVAQAYTRVLLAQQDADQPLLQALRNAEQPTSLPDTDPNAQVLRSTYAPADGSEQIEPAVDLCAPEQFQFLLGRAFMLENGLQEAAIDGFEAESGRDLAMYRGDEELALGFDNFRISASARFDLLRLQYDALTEFAEAPLNADCEPYAGDAPVSFGWLDSLFTIDPNALGSAAPGGEGDTGSRQPQGFHTDVEGDVWAPDGNGDWQLSAGYSFANEDALNRLRGVFAPRCEQFEGTLDDRRAYAFSSALAYNVREGISLDLQFPLYDTAPDAAGEPADEAASEPFQPSYETALRLTNRRVCAEPLDYAAELGLQLNLTQRVFERIDELGYGDAIAQTDPLYDTRDFALRVELAAPQLRLGAGSGDQTGYDADPDQHFRTEDFALTSPVERTLRINQALRYDPTASYTFPNIAPNDAFVPDCFTPQHYGDFRIGEREYVRMLIDPAFMARLDTQGLEVLGLYLDPLRGVLDDPYMRARAPGGGSWGQPFDDQWAIKKVGFTNTKLSAWSKLDSQTRKDVVVAVIDSGLDWHHQDLDASSLWRNQAEIPGNGVDDDGNGYVDDVIGYDFMERHGKPWDRNGHGTLVSGIISAARNNDVGIAGINPGARLMVLKVSNSFGKTNASYIGEAITYAADNGADIINISMGGPQRSRLERDAIAYARNKGVLVVAASGNEGIELDDYGPAAEDGVLTVAATDRNDRHASFSNTGSVVDIAAPGIDVLSLRARGTDANLSATGADYTLGQNYVGADKRYIRASGTSFATPIVTGAASALLALEPDLTADEVQKRLTSTAWDVGKPGRDDQTGAGLLDARTAISVDRNFFVNAEVSRLVPNADSQTLEIHGVADADQFKRAWLQVGEGEDPATWKYVGLKLKRPVRDAILSEIPLTEFGGTGVWTVRINVEHKSGTVRRATRAVRLR